MPCLNSSGFSTIGVTANRAPYGGTCGASFESPATELEPIIIRASGWQVRVLG